MNKELVELRSKTLKKIREFFDKEGFIEVIPPVLVGATGACENVPTIFSFDYFGKKAFLAQTTQLFLEWYVYNGIPKVYSINKSFRAEPRITTRHQTEFTLIEFEASDSDLGWLVEFEKRFIYSVSEQTRQEVKLMYYTEAIQLLKDGGINIAWGDDFSSQAEQLITARNGISIITHYPEYIKFFNMRESVISGTVDCCDLLLPGVGETIGGSEREYRYDIIKSKLENSDMLKQLVKAGGNASDFDWYLDLIKNKEMRRAGAGIGFDRLVQWITGSHSIKDCVEFPRDAETLVP